MPSHIVDFLMSWLITCADLDGAGGSDPPPHRMETHKYRVLSNTGLDPLENQKATKPAFNACWAIIGTLAKRNLNGASLVGR